MGVYMNKKKILSILFASVLCLSPIGVKAAQMYAESEDGTKVYTSIDDAWNAAQNGTKIIMSCDWNLSERLVLDSNKTATIEMNGHKISRNLTSAKTNGEVIKLCSNSTLNLNGKKVPTAKLSFKGYDYGIRVDAVTYSGGLVTGGYSTNGGGGIHMKGGSTLNLDTVSISGNKSNFSLGSDGHGGAIYMDGSGDKLTMNNAEITFNAAQRDGGGVYVNNRYSSIEMNNRSTIVNNSAGASLEDLDCDVANGGGIAVDGHDVTITLNGKSNVINNYCHAHGGGIYSDAKSTKVYLNDSSIESNTSDDNGGGLYFGSSYFEVSSKNKDGQVTSNIAKSSYLGGGIYAGRCVFSSNEGKIDGITFTSNSGGRGGAVSIHQEYVTISNCIFKNNSADCGAAIEIENDNCVLENLTVQENTSNSQSSGAVKITCYNDITLRGTLNITNNKNTLLDCDADLYVETFNSIYSYIISVPDSSSQIGLYINKARTIAKNQTNDAMNIFFVDNPNQYSIYYDDSSKQIISKEGATVSNESNEVQNYTITLNMVNEAGTWQNTQKMTIDENEPLELQAPIVEDKEFVEYKDAPESLTVENQTIKSDTITSDIELTLVYSDSESEESTETGSIFGDGNTVITAVVIVGLLIIGVIIFKKKKQ